jgi:hypothetical protein
VGSKPDLKNLRVEDSALLGYDAKRLGNQIPTFPGTVSALVFNSRNI